jgi:hypothetical protein
MNTALRFGGSIFILKPNKTALSFRGVIQPFGRISFKLEIYESSRSVFRDRDCILSITNTRVSLNKPFGK